MFLFSSTVLIKLYDKKSKWISGLASFGEVGSSRGRGHLLERRQRVGVRALLAFFAAFGCTMPPVLMFFRTHDDPTTMANSIPSSSLDANIFTSTTNTLVKDSEAGLLSSD